MLLSEWMWKLSLTEEEWENVGQILKQMNKTVLAIFQLFSEAGKENTSFTPRKSPSL